MTSDIMDKLVKFNTQSSGRDKLFRLVQYSSRIIWANLEKHNRNKDLINKLKNLEYTLSTARKLYRFGRCSDTLYSALSSINLNDPTLRHTITLSRINNALYLLTDHIIWLGRAGVANIDNAKWSRLSYKLWLYYLVLNLGRDVYEIARIIDRFISPNKEFHFERIECSGSIVPTIYMLYNLLKTNKDVAVDTVKNGCDVCLPLAQLGYLSISPRTIGILGAISSIAGMLPLLDPSYKLSP